MRNACEIGGLAGRYFRVAVLGAFIVPVCGVADDFFEDSTAAVNEGALVFLDTQPDRPVHTHANLITVTENSLVSGWAGLFQCHRHLDPVPDIQIVFNEGRVRNIRVDRYAGIAKAWVEGNSVQLMDVEKGAEICLSAETKVVEMQAGGRFSVRNGPFMRNFLDGYYPMRVRLEIYTPPGEWQLTGSRPAAQPGFTVSYNGVRLLADALFEGRLETRFEFMPDKGEQ